LGWVVWVVLGVRRVLRLGGSKARVKMGGGGGFRKGETWLSYTVERTIWRRLLTGVQERGKKG